MNIAKVDLNLLVYLDVLLREGSVTKAANQLSITQPAMSNGLPAIELATAMPRSPWQWSSIGIPVFSASFFTAL